MSRPNTETIIQGKTNNFTLEELKNASTKKRPFYHPLRPDYSVMSNRVYEKPRHGENILSNFYKPPKILIYSGEFDALNFKKLIDDVMTKHYGYSDQDYYIFSLGDNDCLVKFDDGTETFVIKEGNTNFKTSAENINSYPFIDENGAEMIQTYRQSENFYAPIPGKKYYVFKISYLNGFYNISKVQYTGNVGTEISEKYREKPAKNFKEPMVRLYGGKKQFVEYKPSSFKNLPVSVIRRKSNKAHWVMETFEYSDDGLTNFEINCANKRFKFAEKRKALNPDSRVNNRNIPVISNILDDKVKEEDFINIHRENIDPFYFPLSIKPDIELIHCPKFYRDASEKVFYYDSDNYYYYYFMGRLCRTEVSRNIEGENRKIISKLEYADGNTYTWKGQTLPNFTKKTVDGKIVDPATFRIKTKTVFLPHNSFWNPLGLNFDDSELLKIQDGRYPKKANNFTYEPYAEEFTFFSETPIFEIDAEKPEIDIVGIVLDFIAPFLFDETLEAALAYALFSQVAEIYAAVTLALDIKNFLVPGLKTVYSRHPILTTIFPDFKFEIIEQKGNTSKVKIDRTGTVGYKIFWDRADSVDSRDPVSKIFDFFYDSLNQTVFMIFSSIGINLDNLRSNLGKIINDGFTARFFDLGIDYFEKLIEAGKRTSTGDIINNGKEDPVNDLIRAKIATQKYQEIEIETKNTGQPDISDIGSKNYYILNDKRPKKTITVGCFFDATDEEFNFVDFVQDDSYISEKTIITPETLFTRGGKISTKKIDPDFPRLGDLLNLQRKGNFFYPVDGIKQFKIKREFAAALNNFSESLEKFILFYTSESKDLSSLINFDSNFTEINDTSVIGGIVKRAAFPFVRRRIKYMLFDNIPRNVLPSTVIGVRVKKEGRGITQPLYNLRSLLLEADEEETQETEYSYFSEPIDPANEPLRETFSYRLDRLKVLAPNLIDLNRLTEKELKNIINKSLINLNWLIPKELQSLINRLTKIELRIFIIRDMVDLNKLTVEEWQTLIKQITLAELRTIAFKFTKKEAENLGLQLTDQEVWESVNRSTEEELRFNFSRLPLEKIRILNSVLTIEEIKTILSELSIEELRVFINRVMAERKAFVDAQLVNTREDLLGTYPITDQEIWTLFSRFTGAEIQTFFDRFGSTELQKFVDLHYFPSYKKTRNYVNLYKASILYINTTKSNQEYEEGLLFAYFAGERRIRKFKYYMIVLDKNTGTKSKFFNNYYYTNEFKTVPSSQFINTKESDPDLFYYRPEAPIGYQTGTPIYTKTLLNRRDGYSPWAPEEKSFDMYIFEELPPIEIDPQTNMEMQPLENKIVKSINFPNIDFFGRLEIPDIENFFRMIMSDNTPKFYPPSPKNYFLNCNLRFQYTRHSEYFIARNNLTLLFHGRQKILTTGNKVNMLKVQNSPFKPDKTYNVYEIEIITDAATNKTTERTSEKTLSIDPDGCVTFTGEKYSFIYDFVRYDFELVQTISQSFTSQVQFNFDPFVNTNQTLKVNLTTNITNGKYKIYEIISETAKYEYEFFEEDDIYINSHFFPFISNGVKYSLNHIVPIVLDEVENFFYEFGWQYTKVLKSKNYTTKSYPYYYSTKTKKYIFTTDNSLIHIDEFPIIYKTGNKILQVNLTRKDESIEIRYHPNEKFIPFIYGKEEIITVTNLDLKKFTPVENTFIGKKGYTDYPLINPKEIQFFKYGDFEYKLVEDKFYIPVEIETYDLVYSANFPSSDIYIYLIDDKSWSLVSTASIPEKSFIYERARFTFNLSANSSIDPNIKPDTDAVNFYNLSTRSVINIYKEGKPLIVFSNEISSKDFPFVYEGILYSSQESKNVLVPLPNSSYVIDHTTGQILKKNSVVTRDSIYTEKYIFKDCSPDVILVLYSPIVGNPNLTTVGASGLPTKKETIAVFSIVEQKDKNIEIDDGGIISVYEFPFLFNGKYYYVEIDQIVREVNLGGSALVPKEITVEEVILESTSQLPESMTFFFMYEFGFFKQKNPGNNINDLYFPIYHDGKKYILKNDVIHVKSYEKQDYVYIDQLSNVSFLGNYQYYEEGILKTKFIRILYGRVDKVNFTDGQLIYENKKYILDTLDDYDEKKQCLRTRIGNSDFCYVQFKNKQSYLYTENGASSPKTFVSNGEAGYLPTSIFPFFCNGVLYTLSDEYETPVDCFIPSRSDTSLIFFTPESTQITLLNLLLVTNTGNIQYINHNNYGLMNKNQFPFYYKGVKYMYQNIQLNENILIVPDDSDKIILPDFGSGDKILVLKPYPSDIIPPNTTSPIGNNIADGIRFQYSYTDPDDRAKTSKLGISGGVIKEISNPPMINEFPFYYNNKYYYLGQKDAPNPDNKEIIYSYYIESSNTLFSSNIQGKNKTDDLVPFTYDNLPLLVGNRFYHKGPNNYFSNYWIGEERSPINTFYVKNIVNGKNAARYYLSSNITNFRPVANLGVYTLFKPKEYRINNDNYFIYPNSLPDNFLSLASNYNIYSMGYYVPNSSGFTNRNLLKSDIVVSTLNPMNRSFVSDNYVCQIREDCEPTRVIYYDKTRLVEKISEITEIPENMVDHRGGSDDSVYSNGFFYKEARYSDVIIPEKLYAGGNIKIINCFLNQTSVYIEEFANIGNAGNVFVINGWVSVNYFPFKYKDITYNLRIISGKFRIVKIVSDRMIYYGDTKPAAIEGFKNSEITPIRNISRAKFYSAHIETEEKIQLYRKITIDNFDITYSPQTINGIIYSSSGDDLLVGGEAANLLDGDLCNGMKFRNKYLSINGIVYPVDSFPLIVETNGVKYQYNLSFVHTPRCVTIGEKIITDFKARRTIDYFEEFSTSYGTYFTQKVLKLGENLAPNVPIISERMKIIPLLKYETYEPPLSRYSFVYEVSGTKREITPGALVLFSFGDVVFFREDGEIYKLDSNDMNFFETQVYFINAGDEIYLDGREPLPVGVVKIGEKQIIPVNLDIDHSIETFNFGQANLQNMIYRSSDRYCFIHEGKVYEYLVRALPKYKKKSPLFMNGKVLIPGSYSSQKGTIDAINIGSQILKGDTLYTKIPNESTININSKTKQINFNIGYEIGPEFEELTNSNIPLAEKIFYKSPDTIYTFNIAEIQSTQLISFLDPTLNNFLSTINYNNGELIQSNGILYNTAPIESNSYIYNNVEYQVSQMAKIADIEISSEIIQYITPENLFTVDLKTKLTLTNSWSGDKFYIDGFVVIIKDILFTEITAGVSKSKKDIELNLGPYIITDGKIKKSEKFYTIGNSKIIDLTNMKIYSFTKIDDKLFTYDRIETYYSPEKFSGETVYFLDGSSGLFTQGKPFIYNNVLYSEIANEPSISSSFTLQYGNKIDFISIDSVDDKIVIFSTKDKKDYQVSSNYIPSKYVPFIYRGVEYSFGYGDFYQSTETIKIEINEAVREIDLQINGNIYEQKTHLVSFISGKIPVEKFPFIYNGRMYELEKLSRGFFTYVDTIDLKINEEFTDIRSLLPDEEFYYREDHRYNISGELIFPMVISNSLYKLTKIPKEKFTHNETRNIYYRQDIKLIDIDSTAIYVNNREIEINRKVSPSDFPTFVANGVLYNLIPYTEDSAVSEKIIRSNYTNGIYTGISGMVQLSTGFKIEVNNYVERNLFPFIHDQIKYKIEPLPISSDKIIYGIDVVSISNSHDMIQVFYEDGRVANVQKNSINKNLFPFVYGGSRYTISTEKPAFDKISMIQVNHTNNGEISEIETSDSHVYSENLEEWIPMQASFAQNLFPIIASGVKYSLAKLLPMETIIRTKTVYAVGDNVETDIEETEIETTSGKISVYEGIINKEKFPFVWRNTEYQVVEVYNSNYVIKETKEIEYFYSETHVKLASGEISGITVYYGFKDSKIITDPSNIPVGEFPFIYNNVFYTVKQNQNKTREGLEVKVEKLEVNRYEFEDYQSIENLTIVTRKNTKFFTITNIYKKAKIITDKGIKIIYI